MVLVNDTKKTVLADRCRFANTVFKRMIGLLNRSSLGDGEALLIDRCYGIHTFGMRFAIDVLFLDRDFRVIRAVAAVPPCRSCIVKQALYVVELPVGAIERTRTEPGDQIQMRAVGTDPSATAIAAGTHSPVR